MEITQCARRPDKTRNIQRLFGLLMSYNSQLCVDASVRSPALGDNRCSTILRAMHTGLDFTHTIRIVFVRFWRSPSLPRHGRSSWHGFGFVLVSSRIGVQQTMCGVFTPWPWAGRQARAGCV